MLTCVFFLQLQSLQKMQNQQVAVSASSQTASTIHSPQPQHLSSSSQSSQNPYTVNNSYGGPMQLNPMVPMQINPTTNQFTMAQPPPPPQPMQQGVMRHNSPGPVSGNNHGYVGIGTAF
jgi:hypothetical protein